MSRQIRKIGDQKNKASRLQDALFKACHPIHRAKGMSLEENLQRQLQGARVAGELC
jgi:hypothetical protein